MAKPRKNLLGLFQLAAQRTGERSVFLCGECVLLDADLVTLYGVTTGALNRAVKCNHGRFPADFMLQFTDDGANSLRCQTGILKTRRCPHRKYHPYTFTEQAVAMLFSVLRSGCAELANVENHAGLRGPAPRSQSLRSARM